MSGTSRMVILPASFKMLKSHFNTLCFASRSLQENPSNCSHVLKWGLLISTLWLFENRPTPPLPELQLSEDAANYLAALARTHINATLSAFQNMALGKDSTMYFRVAGWLLLISVIGSLTNFLTLGYTSKLLRKFSVKGWLDDSNHNNDLFSWNVSPFSHLHHTSPLREVRRACGQVDCDHLLYPSAVVCEIRWAVLQHDSQVDSGEEKAKLSPPYHFVSHQQKPFCILHFFLLLLRQYSGWPLDCGDEQVSLWDDADTSIFL